MMRRWAVMLLALASLSVTIDAAPDANDEWIAPSDRFRHRPANSIESTSKSNDDLNDDDNDADAEEAGVAGGDAAAGGENDDDEEKTLRRAALEIVDSEGDPDEDGFPNPNAGSPCEAKGSKTQCVAASTCTILGGTVMGAPKGDFPNGSSQENSSDNAEQSAHSCVPKSRFVRLRRALGTRVNELIAKVDEDLAFGADRVVCCKPREATRDVEVVALLSKVVGGLKKHTSQVVAHSGNLAFYDYRMQLWRSITATRNYEDAIMEFAKYFPDPNQAKMNVRNYKHWNELNRARVAALGEAKTFSAKVALPVRVFIDDVKVLRGEMIKGFKELHSFYPQLRKFRTAQELYANVAAVSLAAHNKMARVVHSSIVAMRKSKTGIKVMRVANYVASPQFVKFVTFAAALSEGWQGYHRSTSESIAFKAGNAAASAGGSVLVLTAHPALLILDLVLPQKLKISTFVNGGALAITSFAEAMITGDFSAADRFHERSLEGAYGSVIQSASRAGDYWAEHGIKGGVSLAWDNVREIWRLRRERTRSRKVSEALDLIRPIVRSEPLRREKDGSVVWAFSADDRKSVSALYFRRSESRVWSWSADDTHWMPVSTTRVRGGRWNGISPTRKNRSVIRALALMKKF